MPRPIRPVFCKTAVLQWLLLALWVAGCSPVAVTQTTKPELPRNEAAERFFAQGESLLQVRNYQDAAIAFDNVVLQPFNQKTTAGLFLAGLAYTNQYDYDKALARFQELLEKYPLSRYADEVSYHKAYIMLRREDSYAGGLYVLLNLIEKTKNLHIKADAEHLLRRFMYETADIAFLKDYYARVRPSYRTFTLEALAYKLREAGREAELITFLSGYEAENGELTERLARLRGNTTVRNNPSELRITVLLPFSTGDTGGEISRLGRVALQLYEGMRLALQEELFPAIREAKLQVLDSKDDPKVIEQLMGGEVKRFEPHLIIGDIRNTASMAISAANPEGVIPQFIPLSDADELLAEPAGRFLINPSAVTCAKAQARYAVEILELKKLIVIYEGTSLSIALADSFMAAATRLGASCTKTMLPPSPTDAQQPLYRISQQLEANPVDAAYMPIHNEELVSVSLFRFSRDSIPLTQVFGPERWRAFRSMDQELLYTFHTIVTDTYEPLNDQEGYRDFTRAYLKAFGAPPSAYGTQGYDIMRFLLSALSANPTLSVTEALAEFPAYKGFSQTFYFGNAHTNQSVQFYRYIPTGIEKLPGWRKPDAEE